MTHMLPGSFLSNDDGTFSVGVHKGAHEWQLADSGIRYLHGSTVDWKNEKAKGNCGDTLISYLEYLYDNSTGCGLTHNFKKGKE